jgi:hypothetical protein
LKAIIVDVQPEHLTRLTRFQNAAIPIEELIRNALDADATNVRVSFETNKAGGIEVVRVLDDGNGIDFQDHVQAFKNYGGSLKLGKDKTQKGRRMLGKSGKGRFKALGLGSEVTWVTRYRESDEVKQYQIVGLKTHPKRFDPSVPEKCDSNETGTEVIIRGVDSRHGTTLRSSKIRNELTRRLAAYLFSYRDVKVVFDQIRLAPETLILHNEKYPFKFTLKNGQRISGDLVIIEWRDDLERMLHLCDHDGVVRLEIPPGIQAKDFSFSAYVLSPWIAQLENEDRLDMVEMDAEAKLLVDHIRGMMRTHFRAREAQRATRLVTKWKADQVYPYKASESSPVDNVEREVFDICAVQIYEHLEGFASWNNKNKQLTFRLVKEALKSSPSSLRRILSEVLSLPPEEQDTLAKILEKTQLSAIINATKIVADRIAFLQALGDLLFGQYRSDLRERDQLHKILAEELWVFGDQYGLGVSDKGLTKLLQSHLHMLGKTDFINVEPVTDREGHRRIVDLMLFRKFASTAESEFEHLVIELKNPRVVLGFDELTQIRNYANRVANDERFDKDQTRWTFYLVGNEIGKEIADDCNQDNRLPGQVTSTRGGKFNIFVKKWSTIMAEANWRYNFYHRELNIEVRDSDGLDYLKVKHDKYLPKSGNNGDSMANEGNSVDVESDTGVD